MVAETQEPQSLNPIQDAQLALYEAETTLIRLMNGPTGPHADARCRLNSSLSCVYEAIDALKPARTRTTF